MKGLKHQYKTVVISKLLQEFQYKNIQQIPKIEKIQVSCGLGLNAQNRVYLQKATEEIRQITGQHPILTSATKSIAGFKIREGMSVGASVTLRQEQMYNFLTKLINIVLPRIRDFRGISPNSFDGRGNYNLGLKEQLIFPEISYSDVTQIRGLDISIVTTAKTDEEARALLKAFGIPFATS